MPQEQRQTLFDKLINNTPDKKVPYPFSKLLSYLEQYAEPVGILIPLGRSLQKKSGYPEPFKDPRRVVAFRRFFPVLLEDLSTPSSAVLQIPSSIVELDIGRRLFLGYVEKAEQIEVISLLPGESEFDFQLVENYRAGLNPVVKTADKAFCRSCHQHGGPIFSPIPWDETNANRGIATLLKQYHPSGHVDGIPVEHKDDAFSNSNPAYIFDTIVRDANETIHSNEQWHKADCAKEKDPIRCREAIVRSAFSWAIEIWGNDNFPLSSNAYIKFINRSALGFIGNPDPLDIYPFHVEAKQRLQSLRSYSLTKNVKPIVDKLNKSKKVWSASDIKKENEVGKALVLNFFLIAAEKISGNEIKQEHGKLPINTRLTAEELNTVYEEVERMLIHVHKQEINRGNDLDPLVKRNGNAGSLLANPTFTDVLRNTLHIFSSYSYQQIDAAITKMVKDTNSPMHSDRLNTIAIVKEVLANLGYKLKTEKWMTDLPATTNKKIIAEEVYFPSDDFGRSLHTYCTPCHGKNTEYNFLYFKTKEEFCQRILSERYKMAKALEEGHMPPNDLIEAERIKLIKTLKKGSFAFCE